MSANYQTGAASANASKKRVALVLGALAFTGSFQLVYLEWLNPVFGYFGFQNSEPATGYLVLAWSLSVIPSLWMPLTLSRPSQLIYWVLYLVVFIPSMFVPLYIGLCSPGDITILMISLFGGFAVSGTGYLFPLVKIHPPRLSGSTFWKGFSLLVAVLVIWVLLVFRANLHIVTFGDVYDLRFAADDLTQGGLVHYAVTWISAVIGPLLLTLGIVNRRAMVFVSGVLVQILVYSATGAKSVILSILIVPLFYLLLSKKTGSFGLKMTWGCALMFISLYLVRAWGEGSENIFTWALSLVFMRTFGAPGLMMGWYQDFFQHNPLTHYSHVTGVNWFIPYPYSNPLGIEVGSFYSGDPTLDANAGFWATDGIGALGIPGILLVSVLCGCLFWVLDSIAKKHNLTLVSMLVVFAAINLANVSIFTSFVSGGLGLLMMILYLMPGVSPDHLTS